jgi:hypothetical protein
MNVPSLWSVSATVYFCAEVFVSGFVFSECVSEYHVCLSVLTYLSLGTWVCEPGLLCV